MNSTVEQFIVTARAEAERYRLQKYDELSVSSAGVHDCLRSTTVSGCHRSRRQLLPLLHMPQPHITVCVCVCHSLHAVTSTTSIYASKVAKRNAVRQKQSRLKNKLIIQHQAAASRFNSSPNRYVPSIKASAQTLTNTSSP